MSQSLKRTKDLPSEESAAADAHFNDLEAEFRTLSKSCKRLLVQRRKLQARVKSTLRSIFKANPELDRKLVQRIERDLELAEENALHLEVWLPEYEQIAATVLTDTRDLHVQLGEALQQLREASGESERLIGRVDELEEERKRRARDLETEAEASHRLRDERKELEAGLAALREELTAARGAAAPAKARAADLESQLTELQKRYRALGRAQEKERQTHAREVATLTGQLTELRERYETQIAELARRCEELTHRIQTAPDRPSEPGRRPAPPRPAGQPPAAADGAAGNGAAPCPEKPLSKQLVVLDDEKVALDATAALVEAGFPVTVFGPHPEVASQLPPGSIACIALNLALANAWTTARRLRSIQERSQPPLIAYALAHPTSRGFWFGQVDFVPLPLTRDILGAALGGTAVQFKQAILITTDDAVAEGANDQLVRGRVSCVRARDRIEALEVVKTVYPHVAFVHPGSSPVDAFRALAAIRGVSLLQRIPVVFLLDPNPEGREGTLFSAAVRTILRFGTLNPADFTESLAGAFQRYVPAPR